MILGVLLRCIQTTSSPKAAAPLVHVAWAAIGQAKSYGSAAKQRSNSLQALVDRGVSATVLEFEISASEAVQRFNDYQRKSCVYLHAHSLLEPPRASTPVPPNSPASAQPAGQSARAATHDNLGAAGSGPKDGSESGTSLAAAYMPYWCFEATFDSEAHAKLGFKDDKTSEVVWKDMTDPLVLNSRAVASYDNTALQVYASYKHVRDVGDGAAGRGLPLRARPLTAREASEGEVGGVAVQAASMKQGVAWQLALRALMHQQRAAAEVAIKEATRATDVKDVHVTMQVHSRVCRLVFLPAYIAVYQYGTRYKQGTSGVIVPQVFTAVVGGTRDGHVAAPQHLSPAKVSLSTGGLVGGLGLLAGNAGSWAPSLLGLESLLPGLGAVEAVTLAALAATGAGMWAHQRPQTLRAHHAAKQVRADYEFYKKYDIHETYGSGAAAAAADPKRESAGDGGRNEEYMLWLWSDADWRRWEHDEPWNWDPEDRQKWAEDLWRKQAMRRLERQRYVERMAAETLRRAAEEEAETRRKRLYGNSARSSTSSHRPRDHGADGGDGAAPEQEGYGQRRRRSDFLGYYRVLGLQDADAVSSDDIKQAFKAQALLLHPDKHVAADADAQRTVLVQFQKLQIAYDTLKDGEKRRLYDRGQLVH